MITSVLVANRGEIARRVFRTCRDLGLSSVAVFSDPDSGSPHVDEADAAVRLPGNTAAQTYLRSDLIIDAARRAGADAIHPGYGFLSENAAFARAVAEARLTWIGPSAEAITAMGSKIESKRLMSAAGVPILDDLDPTTLTERELPVLIKASAGGGGRGMRIVRTLADLPREIELAQTEAQSAFGDATVFCEPYLARGRHIEVQIMGDAHGTIWAVGERECSIQRRHQKVVEEAPAPLVQRVDGLRAQLFAAARAAARTIDYTGAGTVEFLADDGGRFFFLEMNTRLQVEHPVTECTTGLDLVALQLHVADGGRLDAEPPARHGHSIEARLYAEDPAAGWQPQSGTLHRIAIPDVTAEFEVGDAPAGVRLDSGVLDAAVVSSHYDPMLAKVISWAPTRDQAAAKLARSLQRATLHGVRTNRDLLVNLLRHKAFLAGDTDTGFFDRHGLDLLAAPLDPDSASAALAGALGIDAAIVRPLPEVRSGWRNVVSQPQSIMLGGHEVRYLLGRDGLVSEHGAGLVAATPGSVVLKIDGVQRRFAVARYGDEVYVDSARGSFHFPVAPRFVDPAEQVAAGSLVAPMPGTVIRLAVALGDRVAVGQPVLWLDAMKMQHQIDAPADGVITELLVGVGQQIEVGAVLAVVRSPGERTGDDARTRHESPKDQQE